MTEAHDGTLWFTIQEAQDYLKVSKPTLYSLMKDGRLPFYYILGTRQRRIKQADLDALLRPGHPRELDDGEDQSE